MLRRWVRVLILLVTVVVTAAVVWRATANEQARGRMRLASQQTDALAANAVFELWDLRSSLHAYVAPGQSPAFWSGRARSQMESIRARVQELEPAASAAGHSLEPAIANLDALAHAERRALAAVQDGQPLVAGDIIFTEARDGVDDAVRELSGARQALARAGSSREAGTANEQSLLAGALMAVWIFALILLVPVPAPRTTAVVAEVPATAGPGLHLNDVPPSAEQPSTIVATTQAPAVTTPDPSDSSDEIPSPLSAMPAPSEVVVPAVKLEDVAGLCTDLGRVASAAELGPLFERAASLIGARGLVVWLVSGDGSHLLPALAHGYDQKLLARMGPIPTADHNLTAAAFRTQRATRAPAAPGSPGALAVPLVAAGGASGVLAAEVPEDTDLDRAAALAAIIAAQLAGLFPVGAPAGQERQEAPLTPLAHTPRA